MHTFEKRSPMPVPPAALFAYHERPGALARLIPPWEDVRIEHSDDSIAAGSRVVLAMKIGPLTKRWVAEHTDYVSGERFAERQVSGPFAAWTHAHAMLPGEAEDASVLSDHVEYRLPLGAVGNAVGGRYVRGQIERMFAFRHARTRFDVSRHAQFADRPRLRVAVSGAGGAIASHLIPFLTTGGHAVERLVRDGSSGGSGEGIAWNPRTGDVDEARLGACDALVHLAGQNIAVRWTAAHRKAIVASRVDATRRLCERLASMPRRPRVVVCASAVGYYGDRGDEELTESSGPGSGFAAETCQQWEAATHPARDAGIRVVNVRIGVVLAARSGALAKLLTPTKLGVAGRLGSGRQFMPVIAMDDVIGLIHAALMQDDWRGPVNAVTARVRQREFMRTLGKVLRRPTVAPMPAPVVKALFGQMGEELLLASANVCPIERPGFQAVLPDVEDALRFELGR